MAKERERKLAYHFIVEQGKTSKETCLLLKNLGMSVSEVTMSKWVNDGNWRNLRNAKISNPQNRINNIKQIINDLTEDRIEKSKLLKQAEFNKDEEGVKQYRSEIAKIDDAVSKWNKTLLSVDSESKVTLSTYISVMEMIFDALNKFDEKLYLKTFDFQEAHLNEVSLKFN